MKILIFSFEILLGIGYWDLGIFNRLGESPIAKVTALVEIK